MNLSAREYDTYGIVMPKQTHTRVATCQEVECDAYAYGWLTKVDVGTEIGVKRARYIIDHSGRRWTSQQQGGLVTFTFPPGQQCFAEHRIALDKEPIFTLKHGTMRPSAVDGQEWLDRFGTNQQVLADIHDRG